MAEEGEFALIRRFFKRPVSDPAVVLGIGDDAAVVRVADRTELVLAVDMMVEHRHFLPDSDPEALGHKILAVNLSDLAAMGATPRWALLAGALPDNDAGWLASFTRGLFALADAHGVSVVGGDTTRGPRNLCLTIAGEVPQGQAIRRSGATPGDDVWVSGTLGDAMLALAALQRRTTLSDHDLATARVRLERPVPRVALGLALRGVATAMLDISDGLCGDLQHVLDASGVGAVIELASLPRSPALDAKLATGERALALGCVLAGGDDYELCFSAPGSLRPRIMMIARDSGLALTRIGTITPQAGALVVHDESGVPMASLPHAFDHFA